MRISCTTEHNGKKTKKTCNGNVKNFEEAVIAMQQIKKDTEEGWGDSDKLKMSVLEFDTIILKVKAKVSGRTFSENGIYYHTYKIEA